MPAILSVLFVLPVSPDPVLVPLCSRVSGEHAAEYGTRYVAAVCAGEAAYGGGDYALAEEQYRLALDVVLHETPNFDPIVNLAATLYKQGKRDEATRYLDDMDCAIAVAMGEQKCYLDTHQTRANPAIGSGCFRLVCADAFLPHGEMVTEYGTEYGYERLQPLRVAAARLRAEYLNAAEPLEANLPEGWQVANAPEEYYDWRSASPNLFLKAKGDFDGDRAPDLAVLAIRPATNVVGLFFCPRNGQTKDCQYVVGTNDGVGVQALGVRTQPPGTYKVLCRGHCEERPTVTLTRDAIVYFHESSIELLFVWNPGSGRFDRYWLSD